MAKRRILVRGFREGSVNLGCGGKPQKNPKQKMAHSGVLDSQGSLVGGETFFQGEIFSMCSLLVLLRI